MGCRSSNRRTRPHRLARPRFQHASRRRKRASLKSQRLTGEKAKRGGKSTEPRIHGMGFARRVLENRAKFYAGARCRQNARRSVAPNPFRYRPRGRGCRISARRSCSQGDALITANPASCSPFKPPIAFPSCSPIPSSAPSPRFIPAGAAPRSASRKKLSAACKWNSARARKT